MTLRENSDSLNSMSKQDRKRKTSLGVLFWIAAILLILVVFLFNRRNIEQVMESTGLVEVINQRIGTEETPEDNGIANNPDSAGDNDSAESDAQSEAVGEDGDAVDEDPAPEREENGSQDSASETQMDETTETEQTAENDNEAASESRENRRDRDASPDGDEPESDTSEQEEQTRERSYVISLVELSEDGSTAIISRERTISFVTSPLTKTIETLLNYPAESEGGRVRNLIPAGTRLERIWIEEGIAYMDFNEQFRFNPMGVEGQRFQIRQIVTTAVQFPTVDRVQILIEGQRVEFLGGEGTFIGQPLAPEDFR